MGKFDALLEPIEINNVLIKNRVSMSAMGVGSAIMDGNESEAAIDYYIERARGGIGLIHTGASFVNRKLAQGSRGFGIDDVYNIAHATVLTENVHRWGGKIFLQMSPGMGRNSMLGPGFTKQPLSASPNPARYDPSIICREITKDEIKEAVESFRFATQWALNAGFDGIQVHSHAGYLIDQFLSACWNRRTDEYGGSFENRCRFSMEIIDAIRSVAGPRFPITYRYALEHKFKGGRSMEEGLRILEVLNGCGIDAFDLDVGSYENLDYIFPTRYLGDSCMAYVCKEAKKITDKPIINAGNHTIENAVALIEKGEIDMASFGRQCIADPDFVNKLMEEQREEIRPCIACNEECVGRIMGRRTQTSCTVNPRSGFETKMVETPVSKAQNVIVIGAGPGGMEAARCAASRGCSVTVFDDKDRLGGTFRTIATGDFKSRIRALIRWYEYQLKKLNVNVVLNTRISAEDEVLKSADRIFVATGSKELQLPLPGVDNPKVVSVVKVHAEGLPEGKRVVICGGGLSACDTALEYAPLGRDITIVEMRDKLAGDVMPVNAVTIFDQLNQYGVRQLTKTRVVGFTDEGVLVSNADGEESLLPADVIVTALGMTKNMDFPYAVLKKYPRKTTIIGDCHNPAKAGNAIREGYYAAMSIR